MPADLIVYAVVAAGLVFWLRSILGTTHGEERSRPANKVNPNDLPIDPIIDGLPLSEDIVDSQQDQIAKLVKNPTDVLSIHEDAQSGLMDIASADRTFEIKSFLEKVQDAFAIIVESFGEGDRETLVGLLADPVYQAFQGEISAREERGETQATEIHAIRQVEVLEARLEQKTAYITVRFVADETSITRDKNGDIVAGHASKVNEMRDIWVFGRAIKARDPRWWVFETRGDFDGDNEILPNSD